MFSQSSGVIIIINSLFGKVCARDSDDEREGNGWKAHFIVLALLRYLLPMMMMMVSMGEFNVGAVSEEDYGLCMTPIVYFFDPLDLENISFQKMCFS